MRHRIYFSPCGIGLGHVGRCVETAKRLGSKDFEILFSTYSDGVDYVRREGFKVVSSPPYRYWTWPDGTVDPWRSFKWEGVKSLIRIVRQIFFEMRQIRSFKPDLIVSDSRLTPIIAGKILGKPVLTISNQFYVIAAGFVHHKIVPTLIKSLELGLLCPLWGMSDEILVPDFLPPNCVSIHNMLVPKIYEKKVKFTGPVLPVRPENLPESKHIREKFRFDDRPLIYVAVSGPRLEKMWLGEKLQKALMNFPDRYQVVISLGNRNGLLNSRRGNVTVYDWLPQRFEVLKACDLIIGRGSHSTVTQALAYGKPMVLIPTQEQTEQIGNAKSAIGLGVAKAIDQRKLSPKLLLETVDEIFSSKSYWTNAEKIMRLSSKLDALNTIAKRITYYMEGGA
ncbi:MAG: glycosyltransferase [Candidatus Bathyarchaeota archaeon]